MQLRILLPHRAFANITGVTRIVVSTPAGSFGLLPRRLDCTTVLSPGLLSYSVGDQAETFVAVDAGVLVKTGADVLVCVRHAVAGPDLGGLRKAVDQEFLNLSEQEKATRALFAHLEGGLVRGLTELRHV